MWSLGHSTWLTDRDILALRRKDKCEIDRVVTVQWRRWTRRQASSIGCMRLGRRLRLRTSEILEILDPLETDCSVQLYIKCMGTIPQTTLLVFHSGS